MVSKSDAQLDKAHEANCDAVVDILLLRWGEDELRELAENWGAKPLLDEDSPVLGHSNTV